MQPSTVPVTSALVPYAGKQTVLVIPAIPAQTGKKMGAQVSTDLLPKVIALKSSDKLIHEYVLAELHGIASKYEGMEQLSAQNHQFLPMLSWVLMNRLRLIVATVNAPLADITAEQCAQIGQAFAASLALSTSPALAVDEWILKYPALVEFDSTHACFRPMVNEIAKTLLTEANWGAKYRLGVGAGLSLLDMASDINMILVYWDTPGQESVGNVLLACLLLNIVWQLHITYRQNEKAPLRVLLRELFYVLSCTKVGVDAYRVAAGVEQEAYNMFAPAFELSKNCRPMSA
jgi:hypothetical protein